ncbi:MAG: hypothetical protein F4132_03360 [Gemmatimonadetes bacterium]|nr:hypothetical protein [Gemmatimonadota bacterium]
MTAKGGSFIGFLERWRENIDLRAEEAVAAVSAVPQVVGIILGGSVGRGQAWPLSDIDLIYVATDAIGRDLPRRTDEIGHGLYKRQVSEGWSTSVDVGKLFLTKDEAFDLIAGRCSLEDLMHIERVFHALDKCHGGRAAFVSEDCDTARLAALLTKERFTKPVVRARQRERLNSASKHLKEVGRHLKLNDPVSAAVSVEQLARPLVPFLLENWRESDRSFGRVFTRFLREADRNGADGIASQILHLFALEDDDVDRRFALAPPHVVERHDRSYAARRFIGEVITKHDDQRDVLYAFSWYAIRSGEVGADWVGLGTEPSAVTERLEAALSIWNAAIVLANVEGEEASAFIVD